MSPHDKIPPLQLTVFWLASVVVGGVSSLDPTVDSCAQKAIEKEKLKLSLQKNDFYSKGPKQ